MIGSWLFFSADDGTHGRELHKILLDTSRITSAIGINCPPTQVQTPDDPNKAPGACCQQSSCAVMGESACLASNGQFAGEQKDCTR